ncbi:MAG TPA: enolase C-terminal domain-like protein [Pirellulales bacterium]|nr:enolase C-terminal domain-like protein [Pirellulales bacterium]
MRIDSIQLFRVPLEDERSASGARVESVFVEMRSGELVGFGEVSLAVGPSDDQEWSAGAFACLRDWLAPALVDQRVTSGERLQELLAPLKGNARAKSALDMAWWSLEAARTRRPLYQLLRADKNVVRLSRTIRVMDSMDPFLAEIGTALELGYDYLTLNFRPGWDVEMLRAVRQTFPAAPIAIDCDELCTLGQMETFYRLEDFSLKYIEQPLPADDLVGHAMLQSNLRTPICLDQSVTTLARAEQAIELESCRRIRIDIGRVGGLTPAVAIRDVCHAAKISCAVGGGPQSEVAAIAAASLAVSCDSPLASDACALRARPWLRSDFTTLISCGGDGARVIRLPSDTPGWESLLDIEMLGSKARERARVG